VVPQGDPHSGAGVSRHAAQQVGGYAAQMSPQFSLTGACGLSFFFLFTLYVCGRHVLWVVVHVQLGVLSANNPSSLVQHSLGQLKSHTPALGAGVSRHAALQVGGDRRSCHDVLPLGSCTHPSFLPLYVTASMAGVCWLSP
jgi:hypothetical protein